MAEPINHDTGSALGTAGWSAAKGGLLGLLVPVVVGAAIFMGGTILLGGLLGTLPWTEATFASSAGVAASSGWIMGIAGVIGAGFGATFGAIPAMIGGLFGLAKGGNRINAEKAAYREQAQAYSQTRQQKLARKINDAKIEEMQALYPVAHEDGRRSMLRDIQAAAAQEQAAQQKNERTGGGGDFGAEGNFGGGGDFGAPAAAAAAPATAPPGGATVRATALAQCECPVVGKEVVGQATGKLIQERNDAVAAERTRP